MYSRSQCLGIIKNNCLHPAVTLNLQYCTYCIVCISMCVNSFVIREIVKRSAEGTEPIGLKQKITILHQIKQPLILLVAMPSNAGVVNTGGTTIWRWYD